MAAFFAIRPSQWVNHIIVLGIVGAISILMTAIFAWQTPGNQRFQLVVGQVAPYDIVAPAPIIYESLLLTEEARERAAQSVVDQFDSSEGRVRRQQKNRAREVLDFVSIVRRDPHLSEELRTDYLRAIDDLKLTSEEAFQIQELDEAEWNAVVAETPRTLDRIMAEEIRESTIASARRRLNSLVDTDLSDEASLITVRLAGALIQPNSIYNPTRTEEMRAEARSAVPPQLNSFAQGEKIIRAGDVATDEDVEALSQLGLLQGDWDWWHVLRASVMSVLVITSAIGAIYRLRPSTLLNYQELAAMAAVVVIWLVAAKFMIITHDWVPYLFPLAAMSMLVTVLIDIRIAVVLILGFSLTVSYLSNNNTLMISYTTLGALSGALILGRAERLSSFLWAGLGVALTNFLTYIAFRNTALDLSTSNLSYSSPLYLSILLNGGLSASVALIGYFILGNLFNLTTSLQLSELSRPAHPLLRQLLLKAPGTYHHTIIVSNLAERAAAAIGVDALLARVGAYYHDIGKTVRPYFFTENIMEGTSPHDKLDPKTSAQIIISHVTDGLDLAQKYHLPPRIRDFIREHHGQSLMQYFYQQARRDADEDEEINPEDFRYPGPFPRSKETALLLLADTCEAAVRSVRPSTREELETLVNKLIDGRVAEGALNNCDLTFKDLQTVRQVFVQVLQGVHHPRISYPEPVQRPERSKENGNKSNGHHADAPEHPVPVTNPKPIAREIPGVEEDLTISG